MDTITLGAFARSGNHYFQRLVEVALISVRCDWLSHRISDWDNKPNRVTIVRHPLDSVASWISTTRDQRDNRADKVLEWYIAYHETVMSKQITILKFDELTTNPLGSINKVCDNYGINKSFFSNNNTLKAALETDYDFIWANPDKSNYPQICQEIKDSSLYGRSLELFDSLVSL